MPLSFSSHFQKTEEHSVQELLHNIRWAPERKTKAQEEATTLINQYRAAKRPAGQLESFLQEYSLDTEEGLALMTLAEALLRIPDPKTAHALIHDKVAAANWLRSKGTSNDWMVKAAGLGLFMSSKTLDSVISKIGEPFLHQAMVKAMGILGRQFVLGQDIEDAFRNGLSQNKKGYRLSFDILGEGARTAADAERYFHSYAHAIEYIGQRINKDNAKDSSARPGISVKLSALHPRYEFSQSQRCIPEMSLHLTELCRMAAKYDIALTVDAEETPRLNTSIAIMEDVIFHPDLRDWEGFGLAVQAYHKAALPIINHIGETAREAGRRIQMRLVKGAYWDSEIKNAQIAGLKDFPVYTRKYHTDLSYIACTQTLFDHGDYIYPMLATHNAHSIATALQIADATGKDFEFQRLFGMGEGIYDLLLKKHDVKASIYAPVGPHHDLLPYLVRRLLENGANTSFVNKVMSPDAPVEELVNDPVDKTRNENESKHPQIMLPYELFIHEAPHGRINSKGLDLHAPETLTQLNQAFTRFDAPYTASSLIGGKPYKESVSEPIYNPANTAQEIGRTYPAPANMIDKAFETARIGYEDWTKQTPETRANALNHAGDLLEKNFEELLVLLVREGGKTIPDAHDEIREAVDFCRYYANQGLALFDPDANILPGPTGEYNALRMTGRGIFICISPWNFPLAIFTGQIMAALMAGNAVIAKPAEQTPLIAHRTIQLFHEAGIPTAALNLVTGDGRIGAALIEHQSVSGVAFTGSTKTARSINVALARKQGPIVPFIAETGGQNAMIVDSSALPEQVIDDVIRSAFGSAGQRCSALRILCLQKDTADMTIRMLRGRMAEMTLGDPMHLSTDIGPVIDEEAYANLHHHRNALAGFATPIAEAPMLPDLEAKGHYFPPCAFELQNLHGLTREIFGPILHVIRYDRNELDDLLDQIRQTGFGLTLGIHSRIKSFQNKIIAKMPIGNIYVNRSMTGAIVGSQPFGGMGLSGTGPKAGGPHYLLRFAHEKAISINTAAAGGNTALITLED